MNTKTHIFPIDWSQRITSSLWRKALLLAGVSLTTLHFTTSALAVNACDRQNLAIRIRDNTRITLNMSHPSGVQDGAYARLNIIDTANGGQARRSAYGTAPGGTTWLDPRMLDCMIQLAGS